MRKYENTPGYSTPTQGKHLNSTRFINSRKIEFVPGFDLTTPHKTHTSESCHIFRALKYTDSSILSPVLESSPITSSPYPNTRSYQTTACRILDAPDIIDDYYLNLLSWSATNILAVALRGRLYLWHGESGHVEVLTDYQSTLITSVSWMQNGTHLALGLSDHTIKLIDLQKSSEIRTIHSHSDRVSVLAFNNYVLSSGSRDCSIINHDLRTSNYFVKYQTHTQEICGLKWNFDHNILASGSNDNKVCIWPIADNTPIFEFTEHKSAVKALAWSPYKNYLLASGGGSLDKTIRLWDCGVGQLQGVKETSSQVVALEWNKFENELISAHGQEKNQVCIWKANGLGLITEFFGHTGRVLSMCLSPDGNSIVTAAADETIRFWNIAQGKSGGKGASPGDRLVPGCR